MIDEKNAGNDYILQKASEYGRLDIIKYIVSMRVNGSYNYIVSYACQYGQLNIIKFLVGNGVDITIKNNMAFLIACTRGYLNLVKFLVNKNKYGINYSSSIECAKLKNNKNIVKFLKSKQLKLCSIM